jgi:hypothetical protein
VKVGITGHQRRPGLDWDWTTNAIDATLKDLSPVAHAFSSLAIGADQVFARSALNQGILVSAIIPMADYDRFFDGPDLGSYRSLLGQCRMTILSCTANEEECFLAAGQWIVEHSDIMIAVWDGKGVEGRGGTADIVAHSLGMGRQVIHLDPFARTIKTLKPDESATKGAM